MTAGAVGEAIANEPQAPPDPRLTGESVVAVSIDDAPRVDVAMLEAVLDAVTVGVVVRGVDGRPLLSNAAGRGLLSQLPRAIPTGERSHRTLTVEGTQRRVLTSNVPISLDGGAALTAVVTTLREEEPATSIAEVESPTLSRLLNAERRLRATMEHSPAGTAVLTGDGRFIQLNAAMCRLLGRTPTNNAPDFSLNDVTHRDDQHREAPLMAQLLAGEIESYDIEKRFVRPGGDPLRARVTVVAVRSEPGAPDEPGEAVQHIVVQALDISQARIAAEMLTHQSLHDPLTGLANRTLCLDRIQRSIDRGRRHDSHVAVLTCDLDRFRVVNDSIGQSHGDSVLLEVARRLQDVLRAGDTAARLSGDEFVVVCDDVKSDDEAVVVAERILSALRVPVVVDGRVIVPTASIGIALSTPDDHDAMALLRDAGAALHRAKENGAGTWSLVDDELRRRAVDRFDVEHQLRSGLARGELRLHLQPIVDVATGRVVGREALVRWQHPERGLLGPAFFLPVAEETGLIEDLGRWVLGEAARIAVASPELGYVAVNVSPSQVRRAVLLEDVVEVLARTKLEPSRLVVELTESVMLGVATEGRRQLQQLDELGVRIVVDDFGTGFSALSHLRDLPVSGIKIDRSFTAGLGHDPQCERIVEALTGLAQGLGVDLVAEGVETEDQRSVLAGIGCEHAQGYLFGRPEPAAG